jgi:hypothetical protein
MENLSESPKERHGKKAKSKDTISTTTTDKENDEGNKMVDKGKKVVDPITLTQVNVVTTTIATKSNEAEVEKIVNKY